MNGWTPDKASSWTVENDALTSAGKGCKLCDFYWIEVRGNRYRMFIDGRQIEVVTDKRPRTDFGDRFGFFATLHSVAPPHISIRSVKVVALQPSQQGP